MKAMRAIIHGMNYNRQGERRLWNCVKFSGEKRITIYHEQMLMVYEPDNQVRELNLNTFSGYVLTSDNRIIYYYGGKVTEKYFDLSLLIELTANGAVPMYLETVYK